APDVGDLHAAVVRAERGADLQTLGEVLFEDVRDGLETRCSEPLANSHGPSVARFVGSAHMPKITDVEHAQVDIDATREHAYNQVNVRRLRNDDLVCVYNEERFPFHHDSGQTVMLRSRDNGATWTDRTVVLPFTDTTGNWDCGICELEDGTLLVNFTIAGYFKRGIRPEQPSWTRGPIHDRWGDWTWSYKLMSWLGAYVLR